MGFNTENITYPSSNGTDLVSAELFIPTDTDIRAIVQISHGMCEYFDRYRHFAEYLCNQGFLVCGNNHLGHRHTAASPQALGFFAKKDGWRFLVRDVYALTQLVQERFPATPYFLLGHSMGSFIVRCYLSTYAEGLSGVLLSGTGGPLPGAQAARRLADFLCKTQGPQHRNKMLETMAFGHYGDRFGRRTSKDWISRDHQVVDAFVSDPYCSFIFTNAGFRDLSSMILFCNSPTWASTLPKNLPIYLFSGDQDPVGEYGKGVREVCQMLKSAGLFDVTMRLYKGGRHEMLNELNRSEVYTDVLTWMKRKMYRSPQEPTVPLP